MNNYVFKFNKLPIKKIIVIRVLIFKCVLSCFRKEPAVLQRFFSAFFSRLLCSGSTGIPDMPLDAIDPIHHHFHEFLAAAPWVPLPREAQVFIYFRHFEATLTL